MRLLSLCCLLAVGVSLAGSLVACAPEDEEDVAESTSEVKGKKKTQRFDVLQHNIGGGAENDPGDKGIAYTFSQIDERDPDAVTLEEVCYSQYEAFKARYPKWTVLFAQMRASHPGCANGEPKGQVLASPRAMTEEVREDLGDVDPSGDKHFTLLCGAVPMPKTARKVLTCVTHLRAEGADADAAEAARGRQVQRIHRLLKDRVNGGQEVVIAGDFNAGPQKDTLDPLYRLTRNGGTGGGLFDEADQTDAQREQNAKPEVRCAANACRSGEPTLAGGSYAKLDFVFFSHNRVADLGANALANGGSGHRLYKAWAELDL
jgi:endonuclease/exonuclease/phosphatase family metal-dependent hydrolase